MLSQPKYYSHLCFINGSQLVVTPLLLERVHTSLYTGNSTNFTPFSSVTQSHLQEKRAYPSVTTRFPSGKSNFLHRPSHFLSRKHDFLQGNSISYLYYSVSHIAYFIFHLGHSISQMESFVSYLAKANSRLFIQNNHIIHLFDQTLCPRKRMLNKSAKPK